jgi:glycosyltransferase involved in cell wall biosynthesis
MQKIVPIVSVCVLTYNHEKFIKECLEGILKQKVDFVYEIIIGDDFSTDMTQKICQEYVRKYPDRIILISSERNTGAVSNWQRIQNASTGKYIAICEGDDYWVDASKLQKQVDFLEVNPDYSVCYQDAKVINENSSIINHNYGHRKDFNSEELVKGPIIPLHSLCFRNILKDFPIEAYKMVGNHSFIISRLGLYGKGKWIGDSILPGRYRVHSGGSWSNKDKEEKLFISSNTCFWIYQYYKRIGKEKYANYWKNKFRRAILNINSSNNILSFQISKHFIRLGFLNKLLQIKFRKE